MCTIRFVVLSIYHIVGVTLNENDFAIIEVCRISMDPETEHSVVTCANMLTQAYLYALFSLLSLGVSFFVFSMVLKF